MAKIQEKIIVIKVSRLIRDTEQDVAPILGENEVNSLEAVVQELAGPNTLVEIAAE